MNELALFAGAGGGILGGSLLGWRTVCAVEYEPYAAAVLVARQNDGLLPTFPIWDDVRTFDGRPWRGIVDVVSGGFPCQDISAAGKGAGITGSRSGLWSEMARIIDEIRPRYVYVENSPLLVSRGLARVLGDLAALGFDARWGIMGAHHVGAPHKRDRCWIVAYADSDQCSSGNEQQSRRQQPGKTAVAHGCNDVADSDSQHDDCRRYGAGKISQFKTSELSECKNNGDTNSQRLAQRKSQQENDGAQFAAIERADWWQSEPDVGRVAHGVPARVDRLRSLGNAVVPQVVEWIGRRILEAEAEVTA